MEAPRIVVSAGIVLVVLAGCQSSQNGTSMNGVNGAAGAAGFGGSTGAPPAGSGAGTSAMGIAGMSVGAAGGLSGRPVGTSGIGASGIGAGAGMRAPFANGSGGMPGAGRPGIGSGGMRASAGSSAGGMIGTSGMAAAGMTGTAGTTGSAFAQVKSILQMRCSSCHNGARNPNLSSGNMNIYATLTSTKVSQCGGDALVTPGDTMNSALLELPQHQCGTFVMPRTCTTANPCIPMAEIDTISAWITAGAPMQ
jgi:hypothetical protein